jgi:CRISPR system Cascade subunit CasA
MNDRFNLIDEPWIPCLLEDGSQTDLGLRDTLLQAHQIAGIASESPPTTVALLRLLVAMVHRAAEPDGETGPKDKDAWEALWQRGRFDAAAIDRYLTRWAERFDLFDLVHPFYQTAAAAVDGSKAVSVAKLQFQSDNNPTLFDHTLVADPPRVSAARAARLLVAYQSFDTAGLITGAGTEKSAKASPLLQCAVVLARGKNLFETLMLNLYRYSPVNGEPWEFDPTRDKPAWERDEPTRAEDRAPDGYLDLLTWQSRRMRLWPEEGQDGEPVVRRATVMKGFQLPEGWPRAERETMIAFGVRLKPQPGQDSSPPIGFREDRALWRDSLALVESLGESAGSRRPKMFSWLATLARDGIISKTQPLQIDALGLAADRAKLLFWRHERLTLPLLYLGDDDAGKRLRERLREAIHLAEEVGRLLGSGFVEIRINDKTANVPSPLRTLAQELLGANAPVDDLVRHLAPGRTYWAALDEPFRALLERLPDDTVVDEDGYTIYGTVSVPIWREQLRRAARDAFEEATHGLEEASRTIRAVSIADRELGQRLRALLGAQREPASELATTGGNRI